MLDGLSEQPARYSPDICDIRQGSIFELVLEFVNTLLGQSLSAWSVVAMPPGYRDRATALIDEPRLWLSLLAPVDFIVSKLRRGTEEDLADATWITERFHLTASQVRTAADSALAASLEDTSLFLFERTVDRFCLVLEQTAC